MLFILPFFLFTLVKYKYDILSEIRWFKESLIEKLIGLYASLDNLKPIQFWNSKNSITSLCWAFLLKMLEFFLYDYNSVQRINIDIKLRQKYLGNWNWIDNWSWIENCGKAFNWPCHEIWNVDYVVSTVWVQCGVIRTIWNMNNTQVLPKLKMSIIENKRRRLDTKG